MAHVIMKRNPEADTWEAIEARRGEEQSQQLEKHLEFVKYVEAFEPFQVGDTIKIRLPKRWSNG